MRDRGDKMLGTAISIASEAFVAMKDKGGEPYILHCLQVMNDVSHKEDKYKIVAVLHDLLEDTFWTSERLSEEGFSEEVVTAIECMTKIKGEPYSHYIIRVSSNKIATRIKLADLKHNSDITRLKGVSKKDLIRMEKYHKSYLYLNDIYHTVHKVEK